MAHLVNLKARVRKFNDGWIVEVQKKRWYGKKYWIHIISWSGMNDKPFSYSSKELAMKEAIKFFEWDLLLSLREESDSISHNPYREDNQVAMF